ncbi:MAG TPA: DUF998 domain-containing protein [Chitinophagaceae bacterium]
MQSTISIQHKKERLAGSTLRRFLLVCGILSSSLYVAMNIIVPMQFPGYSSFSQTISELSAIDTPTRSLWVILAIVYTLLLVALGFALRQSVNPRGLRTAGTLLIVYGIIGLMWPPMHQREVLAAGGGTLSDTLHIAFTAVAVILMISIIGFCAAAMGRKFRLYSITTVLVMLFFGMLTGLDSPNLEADLPTPWIGVWERICIGAYLLWITVLAIVLLRKEKGPVK